MENNLKKRIMKRVYAVWFTKKVAPAVFVYMPFLLFVALRETAKEFFVVKIFDNFLLSIHNAGFGGGVDFVVSATANTPALPTVVILSSVFLLVLIFGKVFQNLRLIRAVN